MTKYYRVIKENFLWEEGVIIKSFKANDGNNGYEPIDEVFKNEFVPSEYISAKIIENSPLYFERVYPVKLLTKTAFKVMDEAKEILKKEYKGK